MNDLKESMKQLKKVFENYPNNPEPRYECQWCQDTGYVHCYLENGENYPIRFADTFRVERERRGRNYFTMAPCGVCEAGTYRGRATEGSQKAAERWVKENVTAVAPLKATYAEAEKEGFSKAMIEQAFQRLGIRKNKIAGRWVCEPSV